MSAYIECQVMSLQDLIKEYGLVRAKLTLIRHQSTLTEHLSGDIVYIMSSHNTLCCVRSICFC